MWWTWFSDDDGSTGSDPANDFKRTKHDLSVAIAQRGECSFIKLWGDDSQWDKSGFARLDDDVHDHGSVVTWRYGHKQYHRNS